MEPKARSAPSPKAPAAPDITASTVDDSEGYCRQEPKVWQQWRTPSRRLASSLVRPELFFPVLLGVSLYCLLSVPSRMNGVSPRRVSMMRCLLVKSAFVMFGGLTVVASGVRKMF